MRKGELTRKILGAIENLAIDTFDLLDAFLSAGYGASYSKLKYELSRREKARGRKSTESNVQRETRQRYYNFIYKLKRDGLVEEKIRKDKKIFTITKKGREKLLLLRDQNRKKLPKTPYSKEEGTKFIIVTFDVPEKERRKRDWLREALKNLGFKMIQKSVWLGKIKIPKIFLDDLVELKLIDFVEIFEVGRAGTLKHIV